MATPNDTRIVHVSRPRGPTYTLIAHDRNELMQDLIDFVGAQQLDHSNFTFSVAGRPIPRGFKVRDLHDEATRTDRPVRMLDVAGLRRRLATPGAPRNRASAKRKRCEHALASAKRRRCEHALACTRARFNDYLTLADAADAKRTRALLAEQEAQDAVKRARVDVDAATADLHALCVLRARASDDMSRAFFAVMDLDWPRVVK